MAQTTLEHDGHVYRIGELTAEQIRAMDEA